MSDIEVDGLDWFCVDRPPVRAISTVPFPERMLVWAAFVEKAYKLEWAMKGLHHG